MPLYQVISREGMLSTDQRGEIARGITDIHASHTGAPRQFVNVAFHDLPAGRYFTAGQESSRSVIAGTIREGRPIEMRQAMVRDLAGLWADTTGQPVEELLVGLQESDARASMEVGLVMPVPGEEATWYEENQERLTELGFSLT